MPGNDYALGLSGLIHQPDAPLKDHDYASPAWRMVGKICGWDLIKRESTYSEVAESCSREMVKRPPHSRGLSHRHDWNGCQEQPTARVESSVRLHITFKLRYADYVEEESCAVLDLPSTIG
jgi:hypothetical protein